MQIRVQQDTAIYHLLIRRAAYNSAKSVEIQLVKNCLLSAPGLSLTLSLLRPFMLFASESERERDRTTHAQIVSRGDLERGSRRSGSSNPGRLFVELAAATNWSTRKKKIQPLHVSNEVKTTIVPYCR